MPIEVKCGQCGKGLKAPDNMAGKKAKCPGCGTVLIVPAAAEEILDAEIIEPTPAANPFGLSDLLEQEQGYRVQEPDPTPQASSDVEARRPCPACGEMIARGAAKCRFCGEVFDPALKRKSKQGKNHSAEDEDLQTVDWVICVLCSGIGCIVGIVYAIQGKPKGWKMVGISVLVGVVWNVIGTIIGSLANHQ